VEIIPTRPLSKSKHYRLLRIVRKFGGVTGPVGDVETAGEEVSS